MQVYWEAICGPMEPVAKRRFELDTKSGTTLGTWMEQHHAVIFAYMDINDVEAVMTCGTDHDGVSTDMGRILADSPILGKALFGEVERKVGLAVFKRKVQVAFDACKEKGLQPRHVENYMVPPFSIASIIGKTYK